MLHIQLFRDLQLHLEEKPYRPRYGNNILAILVYLALEKRADRKLLASLVWGNRSPESARNNLRGNLHSLGQSPLKPHLQLDQDQVILQCSTDVQLFREAFQTENWLQAETLYQGPLLQSFELEDAPEFMEWLSGWRMDLQRQHQQVLQACIQQFLAEHQPEKALRLSRSLHLQEPLNEDLAVQYVRLLLETHKVGEARAFWTRFSAQHHSELGTLPLHTFDHLAPQPAAWPVKPEPSSFAVLRDFPFSGREDVLQSLKTWYTSEGRPLLLVLGDPGMGKTRLLQEWSAPLKTLVIRGAELEQETPYYALYGPLRQALVDGRLENLMSSWQLELHSVFTDLVPRPEGEGTVTSLRLMEALSQALQVCMQGAEVLVLEDAHWFDAATVRVLQHLFRKPRGTAVVLTARPVEWQQNTSLHQWQMDLEKQGHLQKLQLSALQDLSVFRMVHQISGSSRLMPLARKLYQITGGSPYFTVEYLKSIMQRHHLQVRQPEGWEQPEILESLQENLPDSVREVLVSRLQQEPEGVRRSLELAAALGQYFSVAEVWSSGLVGMWDAAEHLDSAQQRQWITPGKAADYQFSHDLVREVIYRQISPARFRLVHQHLARGLEQLQADAARIAHHFHQAGLKAEAYPYWRKAAQRARELWAHDAGLEYLARALECTSDPEERVEIHIARGRHLQALERLDDWERELDEAWNLIYLSRSTKHDFLKVVVEKIHLYSRMRNPGKVIELADQYKDMALKDSTILKSWFFSDYAYSLVQMGNIEEALGILDYLLKNHFKYAVSGDIYLQMAYCFLHLKKFEHGMQVIGNAIEIFGREKNYAGLASSFECRACFRSIKEDVSNQIDDLKIALDFAKKSEVIRLKAGIGINLILTYYHENDLHNAMIIFNEVNEFMESHKLGYFSSKIREISDMLRISKKSYII